GSHTSRVQNSVGGRATFAEVLSGDLHHIWPRSWAGRALWTICGAATWVALEMILTRLFSGFPWDLLGVSQYQMLPLIQIASFTGVYGISFLIVWVSLSLLMAGLLLVRRPVPRSLLLAEIFIPVIVVAVVINFGLHEIKNAS